MKTFTPEMLQKYLETFSQPDPETRSFIQEDTVGVILLPETAFRYDRAAGYAFELAAMESEDGSQRILFIRIDSWDPKYRANAAPGEIDYVIPLAYDGASDRERLSWTIPFGGAWSDTCEEATLVFTQDLWRDWFREIKTGLAFANPGGESAAFLKLQERDFKPIQQFCA
jgi:hypothetical protein